MKTKNILSKTVSYLAFAVVLLLIFTSLVGHEGENALINSEQITPFMEGWTISVNGSEYTPIDLPGKVAANANDVVTLQNYIPINRGENLTMLLRSSQNRIRILVDDRVIHTFGYKADGERLPYAPGSAWQIVRLPKDTQGKLITIEKISPYEGYSKTLGEIFLGSKASLVFHIVGKGLPAMINSIIIMLLGVMCVIVSLILRKMPDTPKAFWLGILAMVCAGWEFTEARMLQLFIGNIGMLNNAAFILLALMPAAAIKFMMTFKSFANNRILKWMVRIDLGVLAAMILMDHFGVLDFIESLFISHIMIGVAGCYTLTVLTIMAMRNMMEEGSQTLYVSMILLLAFGALDIISFYIDPVGEIGRFFRVGLTFYVAIMGFYTIGHLTSAYSQDIEKQALNRMAYIDLLTGMDNRNAYERWLTEYRSGPRPGAAVCNVDINCLKNINDVYGHSIGDKAIMSAANALSECFRGVGSCYRIGGDEFCIICEKLNLLEIEEIFERVDEMLSSTELMPDLKVSVAYGVSRCEERKGSIDEALITADKIMYGNKAIAKTKMTS